MIPVHHPDPDDLFGYASGMGPEWISLVVACHLTYCPDCRGEVELLEDIGGALLERAPAADGADAPASPSELLQAAPAALTMTRREIARGADVPMLPRPLDAYYKDGALRWRFLAPGVQHIPLTLSVNDLATRVVRFKPGFTVPNHTHEGLELVLVMSGSLRDSETNEVFHAGDLSRRDQGTVHAQHVTDAEPCVCLVASSGPVTPTSLWGRFLKTLAGV